MIARIRTENGFYDSAVFAIYYHKNYSEALVFNKEGSGLILKQFEDSSSGHILICIFIYDIRTEDWTQNDQAEGYSWILGREITDEILTRCKNIQSRITAREWFEIKDKADADGLLNAATYFHDAYVKNIYRNGETLCILFEAWSCEVLFVLEGNAATNLVEGYGGTMIDDEYPLIFDSSIFFENGKIFWADCDEIESFEQLEEYGCCYFSAEKVKWKFTLTDKA